MVEAVEAAGVTAQVNFNFRFYPAVQRARRLVEEGFLGQVSTYRGTFYRSSYIDPQKPLSWKLQHEQSGGGALYDLGSHTLDMATFLLGEVEAVLTGFTGDSRGADDDIGIPRIGKIRCP